MWTGPVVAQDGLDELDFEQLMDIEVSTVSRKAQPLSRTAAAAFVISREDIRRSGATSIPEALRLAPGVHAAQISASKWSLSIRGFGGRFANKLLVLMDGRTVYTPAFAGTYWSMQDTLLEDIERIEVIRGPGATLWGANAVNGIINIITRHASDTQGGVAVARAGGQERAVAARWGAAFGEEGAWRVYAKSSDFDEFETTAGAGFNDDFQRHQAGFRLDWLSDERDQFSLHGDIQRLDQGQSLVQPSLTSPPTFSRLVADQVKAESANLVGRWERSLAVDSEFSLQVYFDFYDRQEAPYNERRSTVDLDFQHHLAVGERHDLVWGMGYRRSDDHFSTNAALATITPTGQTLDILSAFVQDEIELSPEQLWLTLGSKVERNDYTGVEWQPSARLLWAPSRRYSLWGSVSRAVRTPSRGERDILLNNQYIPPFTAANPGPLPVLVTQVGNPDLDSETLVAWELGTRWRPLDTLTLDAALFYNEYDGLRAARALAPVVAPPFTFVTQPFLLNNQGEGETYGLELALDWHAHEDWRVQASWSLFQAQLSLKPGNSLAGDPTDAEEDGTPGQLLSLRSAWTPRADTDVDLWLRSATEVPASGVRALGSTKGLDDYLTLDARLAWRPRKGLELSLVGKNLFDRGHAEAEEEIWQLRGEVPRSVYLGLRVEF